MECKVVALHKQIVINFIRIEPDWNVKAYRRTQYQNRNILIRIEPDWNVKYDAVKYIVFDEFIRIEPDWNVKIMFSFFVGSACFIRIEPDWNVKVFFVPLREACQTH